MENLSLQEFDMAFFNDGRRIADECFKEGLSRLSLVEMTQQAYAYVDLFIDQFTDQCNSSNSRVDCKKGCAWCCHQSVFVLPHEAFYLFKYIQGMDDKKFADTLKERIIQKNEVTGKKDLNFILSNTQPCPFLEDKICSVYAARPMACRLFHSMDVQSCITERENPLNMGRYAKLYELPLRAGRMLNEGIGAWFTEKGIKSTEWIIESSLHLLIQDEKQIYYWLKGEENFKTHNLSDDEWNLLRKFDRG
jgi:Fe-S-cluster containining protein